LVLFGYKRNRTERLQLGNILSRSGTIPLQKIEGTERLRSGPLSSPLSLLETQVRYLSPCWPPPPLPLLAADIP
jgi:hypothetical protein